MSSFNTLLQPVDFQIEQTPFGAWKRHRTAAGSYFAEFTSTRQIFGLPLFHYVTGKDPQTGRRKMAVGIVAIGRIAIGVFPIGQLAIGLFPFGQLSLGLIVGFGQLATGLISFGQIALGVLLGIGQISTGALAIGQFAIGYNVLAQRGFGVHVWDMVTRDPAVGRLFRFLRP
jgi:hypothetical protein